MWFNNAKLLMGILSTEGDLAIIISWFLIGREISGNAMNDFAKF